MVELLQQGGIVLHVILGISIVAWFVILWKTVDLVQEKWWNFDWAHEVVHKLGKTENYEEAILECRRQSGIVSRSMCYVLNSNEQQGDFESQCRPFLDAETLNLQKFLPLLSVLAGVLPLLGLLGTVMGMVTTFDSIVFFGRPEPSALAKGVGQALITTEAGLLTSLPIYLIYAWLHSRTMRCADAATLFAKKIHSSKFGKVNDV